jgi:hypothetical protein
VYGVVTEAVRFPPTSDLFVAASWRLTSPAQVPTPRPKENDMSSKPPSLPAWGRRVGIREELASLHERAQEARQAAEAVRDESREIVARCVDGRIRRENDGRKQS